MPLRTTLVLAVAFAACGQRRDPVGSPSVQPTPAGPSVALPPPFQTPSVRNMPVVGPRPGGAALRVPAGFAIAPFATSLEEPRWLAVAPGGDVFVAERRAGRVTVLRDRDGDGRAESRFVFAGGLNAPFGMAFHPAGWLYVANTDGIVRFRYVPGQTAASAPPERVVELPGGGYNQHWTRTVVLSPDASHLFVGVGSATNDSVETDVRRAAISEYDLDGTHARVFASGLRNAVGLAFHPGTHALFAVVNERDEMGDELVPDYLTEVHEGAFYGWPYAYFGSHEDPRHRGERPDLVARTTVPDLSLGSHVAPLGLMFCANARWPAEYRGDALVALHGSWNRSHRVGYKVVRVRFRDGRPTGAIDDFVAGWLTADELIWGRPVGLTEAADGAVLIADDGADTIWRVALR